MRRPDLTFERVKRRFAEMLADPAFTVQELAQHLKLASYADGTEPADKIIWLMGVADWCDHEHSDVASVAVNLIAKMTEYALDYHLFSSAERDDSALRVARFLSTNPACARMDGDYKKSAVKFLNNWWKSMLPFGFGCFFGRF